MLRKPGPVKSPLRLSVCTEWASPSVPHLSEYFFFIFFFFALLLVLWQSVSNGILTTLALNSETDCRVNHSTPLMYLLKYFSVAAETATDVNWKAQNNSNK